MQSYSSVRRYYQRIGISNTLNDSLVWQDLAGLRSSSAENQLGKVVPSNGKSHHSGGVGPPNFLRLVGSGSPE
jgi:hypothetical protein